MNNNQSNTAVIKMDDEKKIQRIRRLLEILDENLSQSSAVHNALLDNQLAALRISSMDLTLNTSPIHPDIEKKIAFTKNQLREFGTGSIAKCFGDDYMILDPRPSPRIPNGDLLMIDSIPEITGERHKIAPPASSISEYTIDPTAWFLRENPYRRVPLAILMELALQPCGIISAYIGTSLHLPPENNRFRNLDGFIRFTSQPDLSGKTITNYAVLLDAFSSGGMHIQKYAFSLSAGRSKFLEGESTFGYFTSEAMANQSGLGQPVPVVSAGNSSLVEAGNSTGHFALTDFVNFDSSNNEGKNLIITGVKELSADEWFYANHFYQDPVMPGSLGAEAIVQGLWTYFTHSEQARRFKNPVLAFDTHEEPFTWKYRGQVTPQNKQVLYRVEIIKELPTSTETRITAHADFWVDGLHIYSFKNISAVIKEG